MNIYNFLFILGGQRRLHRAAIYFEL